MIFKSHNFTEHDRLLNKISVAVMLLFICDTFESENIFQ